VQLEYLWMPGTSPDEFGINDADLSATFAIPFLRNPRTPLLITPGFAGHWWNGPEGWRAPNGMLMEVPSRVYDAYLAAAWNPELSPVFGGELGFQVGVHSDFKRVVEQSVRFQGYGYGVIAAWPNIQVKAGVVYLDRQNIKLLPAGGLIWQPSDLIRFDILFPNPRISMRLPSSGQCKWEGYVRGEYGGGSWTIVQPDGSAPRIDYNDIRFAVGVDFETVGRYSGLNGDIEVGVAFERELFRDNNTTLTPNSTVFVGAGLGY
jgi:hypothetical protein